MTVVKTPAAATQPRSPTDESEAALQAVAEHAEALALFRQQSPTLAALSAAITAGRASASQAWNNARIAASAARARVKATAERAAGSAAQLADMAQICEAVGRKNPGDLEAAQERLRSCTEALDDVGATAAAEKIAAIERSSTEALAKRRPLELRVDALRKQSSSSAEQALEAEESELEAEASLSRAKFGLIAIERDAAVCEAIAMDAYLRTVAGPPGGPGLSRLARGRVEYLVGESRELLAHLGRATVAPIDINAQAVDRIALGHNVIPS
jgi:hypothetical protein